MASHKVIISCAVTGSIHTPSMSPHLPVTPAEIAESALGAAAAGAAIVHLHARNPVDGRPDQSPEAFEPFLRVIKQSSNVVVKPDDRRLPLHDGRGARAPSGDLEAGGRKPQHGVDEFRPVPNAEALQDLRTQLGTGDAGRLPRSRLPQLL